MTKGKAEGPKAKERLVAQKSVNVLEQLHRVFKVWIILVLKGYCYNLKRTSILPSFKPKIVP